MYIRAVIFRAILPTALLAFLATPQWVVAQENRSFDSIVNEAKAARQAGDLERAAELVEEAYKRKPLPVLLNNLGKVYEELGRYKKAIDCYQKVADDPKADSSLRALDTARIGALTPRLASAWIRGPAESNWERIVVAGEVVAVRGGEELPVPVGKQLVLIQAQADTVHLLHLQFVRGRRTSVIPTILMDRGGFATIDLKGISPRPQSIFIDGRRLDIELDGVEALHIEPGSYQLRVERGPGKVKIVQLTVQANQAVALRTRLSTHGVHDESGLLTRSAPSDGLRVGPLVTVGASLILVGVGGYLLHEASQLRGQIADSVEQHRNFTDGPLTFSQEQTYAMQDDADSKSLMGSVFSITGTIALGAGIAWWLYGDTPTTTVMGRTSVFMSPTGLRLDVTY